MSRQDGGTHGYWPPGKRLHRGGNHGAVARSLALVGALFLLPACEALLGSAATVGGTYLIGALKDDGDRNIAWRAKQTELVANVITGMQTQCRALEGPDMTKALTCYEDLLAFHADQLPEILLERLADRARGVKDVAPEPKMVQPAERLSFPSGFPEVLRSGG